MSGELSSIARLRGSQSSNLLISPSVFCFAKSTVSAAASVGASASQRCPPDTRALVRWRQRLQSVLSIFKTSINLNLSSILIHTNKIITVTRFLSCYGLNYCSINFSSAWRKCSSCSGVRLDGPFSLPPALRIFFET